MHRRSGPESARAGWPGSVAFEIAAASGTSPREVAGALGIADPARRLRCDEILAEIETGGDLDVFSVSKPRALDLVLGAPGPWAGRSSGIVGRPLRRSTRSTSS